MLNWVFFVLPPKLTWWKRGAENAETQARNLQGALDLNASVDIGVGSILV